MIIVNLRNDGGFFLGVLLIYWLAMLYQKRLILLTPISAFVFTLAELVPSRLFGRGGTGIG